MADRLPSKTTSRVVVLRHMFTQDELKEDPTLLLDLKQDVREDAEQIGKVTNVVLYDVSVTLRRRNYILTHTRLSQTVL